MNEVVNNIEIVNNAIEKLNKEMSEKDDFVNSVISYLIERCKSDNGLAEDICQNHKTWEKCLNYIKSKAIKYLKNKNGYIPDSVVFEWAEDYFHLDDKAEEEK